MLVKNENVYNKIDNRWDPSPHIVFSQPNTDVPVFEVKNLETQVIRIKHRNHLLPVYRAKDIVIQKKHHQRVKRPVVQKSGSDSETSTRSSSSNSSSVHVIIKPYKNITTFDGTNIVDQTNDVNGTCSQKMKMSSQMILVPRIMTVFQLTVLLKRISALVPSEKSFETCLLYFVFMFRNYNYITSILFQLVKTFLLKI